MATDNSTPLSFKKRTASKTLMSRDGPPGRLDLPKSPFASNASTPTQLRSPSGSPAPGLANRKLRQPSRVVSNGNRRVSTATRQSVKSNQHNEGDPFTAADTTQDGMEETKAPVPSMLPDYNPPTYVTPLPKTSMLVLCICMLAEFLSASTPAAFMYFLIESFFTTDTTDPPPGLESQVALWNGIVSSVFFLSQFVTSLLWASVAQKHGRRNVLCISLLGNAASLTLFGLSRNVNMAIVTRLGQGVFCGSVGVARGAVRDLTDPTNEARAYSLMGLSWGFGGVIGPIIGGLTEHPAVKFPSLFGEVTFLKEYPYFFPCFISSCFCLTGAFLCLFLNRDAGPREGAIQLPPDKEAEEARTPSLSNRLGKRLSTYFQSPSRYLEARHASNLSARRMSDATEETPLSPGALNVPKMQSRRGSTAYGTSYGYDQSRSYGGWANRRYTNASAVFSPDKRRDSVYERRGSTAAGPNQPAEDQVNEANLTFAQRLLLANETGVFSISDLWVQNAIAADDQYSQMDWAEESVFEDEEEEGGGDDIRNRRFSDTASEPPSLSDLRAAAARQATPEQTTPGRKTAIPSDLEDTVRKPSTSLGIGLQSPRRDFSAVQRRRTSAASARPAILQNTGLPESSLSPVAQEPPNVADSGLAPIPEHKPQISPTETITQPFPPQTASVTRSPFYDLPLGVIAQLFFLALHGVGCDQIFMTFLVTPVNSGGLGLTAAHYSELVAVMVFFQMLFQFKAYPNIGPPRGTLTHLSMLRLGLSCYIPVYFFFPTLRALYNENSNALVMAGMIFLSAIRFFGNTCAYTSIMVLTNAMSPPHLTQMANGLAQSAASAARFLGPLLGGSLWSWAIKDGPTARAYPLDYHFPFYVIATICAVGLLSSLRIR